MVTSPTEGDGVPWMPECIRKIVDDPGVLRRDWAYIVLEEIVDDTVELISWAWPLADQNGRLFWPPDDERQPADASVPRPLLQAQLYTANKIERSPRAGDTFACPRGGPGWSQAGLVTDLRLLFPANAFDISADAREAAKLAYEGALAAVHRGNPKDPLLLAAERERLKTTVPPLEIGPPSVPQAPRSEDLP